MSSGNIRSGLSIPAHPILSTPGCGEKHLKAGTSAGRAGPPAGDGRGICTICTGPVRRTVPARVFDTFATHPAPLYNGKRGFGQKTGLKRPRRPEKTPRAGRFCFVERQFLLK
jgi:hypothetical protein